jgi:DNA-binding XRE family transcriptional regulator
LKERADTPIGYAAATVPEREPRGDHQVPSNNVQRYRESLMMSKAELARKSGLSTLTIDRVEAGRPCRLDTKRKILLALGMKVGDKDRVFGGQEAYRPMSVGVPVEEVRGY